MSQHGFETIHAGERTDITLGWDASLQGFFMVIEKPSDEDVPFWCNLIDAEVSHPKTLQPFLKVLDVLGITLPPEMIEEVTREGIENVGNKQVMHSIENGVYARDVIGDE